MKHYRQRFAPLLCALAAVPFAISLAQAAPVTSAHGTLVPAAKVAVPFDRNGGNCQDEDGVKVTPCRVMFDSAHPGPDMVVIDSSGKAVAERDNCASRGIAMVAANGDLTYTVTAGSTAGVCFAHFVRRGHDRDNGHQTGAVLTIVNRI